ncbi:hypothetical protein [Xanthomonas campestris]|uniref:hypothetical protein n=1 Tax=Xanthomonas campestris TaxID=339 RepID=UPI002B22C280|nr:hypothetical protein [Xanthomonas campestris]
MTDLLWLKINRRCASALPARRHASAERGWRVAVGPVCWGDEWSSARESKKVQGVPAEGANITRVVFIVQGLYAKK